MLWLGLSIPCWLKVAGVGILFPDIRGKAFSFLSLNMMLAMDLLYMAFTILRYVPSIPTLLIVCIINRYQAYLLFRRVFPCLFYVVSCFILVIFLSIQFYLGLYIYNFFQSFCFDAIFSYLIVMKISVMFFWEERRASNKYMCSVFCVEWEVNLHEKVIFKCEYKQISKHVD